MRFCSNCGKEVDENAAVCVNCGHALSTGNRRNTIQEDTPNAGWGILGFFIPLVGLILYLIWKDEYPLRAKMVGKWALIGFIVNVALTVLYIALYVVLMIFSLGML